MKKATFLTIIFGLQLYAMSNDAQNKILYFYSELTEDSINYISELLGPDVRNTLWSVSKDLRKKMDKYQKPKSLGGKGWVDPFSVKLIYRPSENQFVQILSKDSDIKFINKIFIKDVGCISNITNINPTTNNIETIIYSSSEPSYSHPTDIISVGNYSYMAFSDGKINKLNKDGQIAASISLKEYYIYPIKLYWISPYLYITYQDRLNDYMTIIDPNKFDIDNKLAMIEIKNTAQVPILFGDYVIILGREGMSLIFIDKFLEITEISSIYYTKQILFSWPNIYIISGSEGKLGIIDINNIKSNDNKIYWQDSPYFIYNDPVMVNKYLVISQYYNGIIDIIDLHSEAPLPVTRLVTGEKGISWKLFTRGSYLLFVQSDYHSCKITMSIIDVKNKTIERKIALDFLPNQSLAIGQLQYLISFRGDIYALHFGSYAYEPISETNSASDMDDQ